MGYPTDKLLGVLKSGEMSSLERWICRLLMYMVVKATLMDTAARERGIRRREKGQRQCLFDNHSISNIKYLIRNN